jgi:negative regulator of flagellin synthesis FlgM
VAVNLNGIDLGSSVPAGSTRKTHAVHSSPAGSQDSQSHADGEVSITSTASLLARLQQSLGTKPAFDQARVDSIRKALAEGKYTVNPGRVAQGLTQMEHALSALQNPEDVK